MPYYPPASSSGSGSLAVGTTAISGGTDLYDLFRNGALLGARPGTRLLAEFVTTNQPAAATTNYRMEGSEFVWITVPVAFTITHIVAAMNAFWGGTNPATAAAVTAGQAEFQVIHNNTAITAAGRTLIVDSALPSQFKAVALATPIVLAAGDVIGLRCVTNAGYLPTTCDPRVGLWGVTN